jgi:hypothetical protein
VVERNGREMNGDRPSDRLTYAHRFQSTTRRANQHDPTPTRKSKIAKVIRMGRTVLVYLRGVKEQTVIIFENFTQELVECKERAYRVSIGYGRRNMERNPGDVTAYRGEFDEYITSHRKGKA